MSEILFKRVIVLGVVTILLQLSKVHGQEVVESRDIYKEYITIRKLIGEEDSTWREQKVVVSDLIEVVKKEIEETKEIIDTLENSSSTADMERSRLRDELEAAKATSVAFNEDIESYEARLYELIDQLPDPLQLEIAPLTARLPEDPSNSRLSYSQRLQTVVGILAQIDKFNSGLKSVTEIKKLEGGSYEVQTLYFGLANALFSNTAGTYAGYGKPSTEGWVWTQVQGEEAKAVASAIDIYAARKAPAFVTVPFVIE